MRLSQLEIFGFKSFAQKVTIPFGPGITAVVGPNGCGKSNVVEAIRWVLGEQRAGTFRSHRMEDVIFAGTRNRKPLGLAEVSLVIENTGGILPIEFSEVTLTRRLFRSGDSDYLMNKVPCRLLDITNLLMDTGLGQGAYAVMEQGMVDEIVSERTENRRRILEEAAGITKYKTRRRSTWSKLESTQADLTRIEDIIAEVKRQVDYLSRQVGRARRYQQLKQEFDALEVALGRHRFFVLRTEIGPLQQELDELTRSNEEGYTRFTGLEAELERLRLEGTEAEKALQSVGIELSRRIDEIQERDRRLVSARERLEATGRAIERAARDRAEYAEQLQSSQQQQQETTASLAESADQQARVDEQLAAREEHAGEAELRYAASRAELEGHQRSQLERLREQAEVSRSLERLTTERDGLREQADGVQRELESLTADHGSAAQAAAASEAGLTATRSQRERLEAVRSRVVRAHEAAAAGLRRLEEEGAQASRAIEANEARLHVMEAVRSGYQGYSSGVRSLLLDSPYGPGFLGVLGDRLDADERYLHAVETALGESLEALVGGSDLPVTRAIAHLEETMAGRAGIYPLAERLPPLPPATSLASAPGLIGRLLDFVRPDAEVEPLVRALLHNTYLVEDLSVALELRRGDGHLRFVTPAGQAIDLHGRVCGGRAGTEDASLLGRRQEIRALRTVIAHEKARLAANGDRRRGEQRRLEVLAGRLRAVDGRLGALLEQEREHDHRLRSARQEAERLERRLQQLGVDRDRLAARQGELGTAVDAQEERLGAAEEGIRQLEATIRACEERARTAEAARRDVLDQLAALRVERARFAETTSGLRRDAERLQHLVRSLQQNIERLALEAEQARQAQAQLTGQCAAVESELKDLHEGREELARQRDERQQHWAETNARNRELDETIARLQRQLHAQLEKRHQLEMRIAELGNQATHTRDRLREEQGCDIEALGTPEEETDAEAAAERVDQLRQSLLRLGSVHLGVLEEYEEQKERYDFLCQQRDDLTEAAEDLKKTLRLIDRTARRMFTETFELIRQKFRETFIRFFAGGEADLQLQADVDPLEAEIDIIARPRGKRLQSISLLSGGERALTAISLLFAIYLVKPSPFCILDEVDAPLDDANIGRFVKVLKEFSRSTQYIMVTHNKISMSAADTLHGVTMPEEGVSQLVSVQMDDDLLDEAAG